jgi:5,10-methylenetetrahydrofolate reductase
VRGLLKAGVPGVHFYVLNRADTIRRILDGIAP